MMRHIRHSGNLTPTLHNTHQAYVQWL